MSNGRLRLELSDAGSRFRVGDMKGRIRASTRKSTFKMVTVSRDLERAHGAQRGGIRACGVTRSTLTRGELARGAAS
jgi:hypothetical protein